ncbi:MAG: hypothetical protein R3C53_28845 [Pirellulaceae bacterium]
MNEQFALPRSLPITGKRAFDNFSTDVGSYLDGLTYAPTTKKLHLSALKHFFDTLVIRHVVVLNAAASVRGERLQVVEGKTPEIAIPQARTLLQSIDVGNVVGLRDEAIIGILIYTAARRCDFKLRRRDFYDLGIQYCLRFTERNQVWKYPLGDDLQRSIKAYLDAGQLHCSDGTSR